MGITFEDVRIILTVIKLITLISIGLGFIAVVLIQWKEHINNKKR